jgi:hypothetical protein
LQEETNNDKFKIQAIYKNLHRYRIDPHHNGNLRHTGYKGQKQSLAIAEFQGTDSDIKVNFWDHQDHKWVPADQLLAEAHPVRRTGYEIYLKKLADII